MAIGWQQILIVLILALLLFGGRGRISSIMGDFAKGIKSFRKGLEEEPEQERPVDQQAELKNAEKAETASKKTEEKQPEDSAS